MAQLITRLKILALKLRQSLIALSLAVKHPDTPILTKYWILFIVAYALSPIDLIPDFIPIIGYLDDLILLPLGIWLAVKMIPGSVWIACCFQAAQQDYKLPISQNAGIFIILIWVFAGVIVFNYFYRT